MAINPSKLKRDPNRPYTFKSLIKTLVMRMVDLIGHLMMGGKPAPVAWNEVKRIAVLRLDHLGDVILALPALQALEDALPQARIDLFIGPWAKEMVGISGLRCGPKIFPASWFVRQGAKGSSLGGLKRMLEDGKYEAVLELRGDFRHILAMYAAGIKHRIGLARTGFGFLLTHPLTYHPGLHETERNMDLLEQAGIQLPVKPGFPQLHPRPGDDRAQKEVRQKLGITRPMAVLHVLSPALSKRWPASHWRRLIEGLPEKFDVVLIGTEAERAGMEEIREGCQRKIFLAAGLLDLPALAAFLRESALFIGLDSGPAHLAAAVGTPVLSLYSGTNVAAQWAPRGPKVAILQKMPPCSPCELTICPLGNECMRQITVEEALEKAGTLSASSV